MRRPKTTAKPDASTSSARWIVLLFVGIVIGGTALVLDRIFDLGRGPIVQAVVGASILLVLISFLGFMSRFLE